MPKVWKIPGEPAEQLSEGPNAEIEAKQVALKNLLDTSFVPKFGMGTQRMQVGL